MFRNWKYKCSWQTFFSHGCFFCMKGKIARLLLMLLATVLLFTCGSRTLRQQIGGGNIALPFAVRQEMAAVLPHLQYDVDLLHVDKERGLVELSFSFVKETGDSLLWIECVEKVPLSLLDTTGYMSGGYWGDMR